jgi:hypothetical protein
MMVNENITQFGSFKTYKEAVIVTADIGPPGPASARVSVVLW